MNIELIEQASSEIAEYNPVAAGLAELKRKYANVAVDVTTPKALDEAKRVRAEIREPRYENEKIRKLLKAPALAHAKLINTEAARITAELLAIETPWDEAIKAEEARKEAEKAAKEAAERARITAIHERIAGIKEYVALAAECRTSARIQALQDKLAEIQIEGFDEFSEEAASAQQEAGKRVEAILSAKLAEETERERVKAEQEAATAKLAAERAAFAAQQAAAQAELAAKLAAMEAEQAAARKIVADHQAALEARAAADKAAADKLATEQAAAQQAAEFEAQREAMAQALQTVEAPQEQTPQATQEAPIWLNTMTPAAPAETADPCDADVIWTAAMAVKAKYSMTYDQACERLAQVTWKL